MLLWVCKLGVDYPDLKTEMEIGLVRLRILLEGSCVWM